MCRKHPSSFQPVKRWHIRAQSCVSFPLPAARCEDCWTSRLPWSPAWQCLVLHGSYAERSRLTPTELAAAQDLPAALEKHLPGTVHPARCLLSATRVCEKE